MDFADRIRELAANVRRQLPNVRTEEATKHALVMPFIAALGYNVFDSTEVTPELVADVGVKKGEKVDYAILRDGQPAILFECKHHTDKLSNHGTQLFRYFSVTPARFGVLTNGILYRFFSDLDAPNKMDSKPFFEFNLLDYREQEVEELKKFSKPVFDLGNILATASELKYTREIQRIIAEQLHQPSEEFVRFFASQIYEGKLTQAVREQFTSITQRALKQFVNDQINERLRSALGPDAGLSTAAVGSPASLPPDETEAASEALSVVTTADELQAFYIVKAVLHGVVDTGRVAMRDVQSYCGVLLDDNNRKPICRLHFNRSQKYLGLFDNPERKESRVLLGRLDDIYGFADRLRATVTMYAGEKEPGPVPTAEEVQA